jgi:hypothetical protein
LFGAYLETGHSICHERTYPLPKIAGRHGVGPVLGLHLKMGSDKHREGLAQRSGRVGPEQRIDTLARFYPGWSDIAQLWHPWFAE